MPGNFLRAYSASCLPMPRRNRETSTYSHASSSSEPAAKPTAEPFASATKSPGYSKSPSRSAAILRGRNASSNPASRSSVRRPASCIRSIASKSGFPIIANVNFHVLLPDHVSLLHRCFFGVFFRDSGKPFVYIQGTVRRKLPPCTFLPAKFADAA